MRSVALRIVIVAIAIAAALPLCVRPDAGGAAPSPAASAPHHTMRLIKLPDGDYTVPMNDLIDPAWHGEVTLHGVDGGQTMVTVMVHGKIMRKHFLELHPGRDCNAFGAGDGITLNPANTGSPSRTVINIPIEKLQAQDYVVAVRNATTIERYAETCAHF